MILDIALTVTGILIFLMSLFALGTSIYLWIRYAKYNRLENSTGLTGQEVAREILDDNDLSHIKVTTTGSLLFGNSYSHYFKAVRLRRMTRHETSLTSLGMGAQKAALALLDKEKDPDMKKQIRLVPLITFGPFAFIPLILVGVLLDIFVFQESGVCTLVLGSLGALFYAYSVFLSILTLKTEKKAQQRAYTILQSQYRISEKELQGLQELFRLYNIQYVNDIILSSLEMIYTVLKIIAAAKND